MCTRIFHDLAVFILDAAGALHQVRALQAALGAVGIQALILENGRLQKVLVLDPQVAAEGDLVGAGWVGGLFSTVKVSLCLWG